MNKPKKEATDDSLDFAAQGEIANDVGIPCERGKEPPARTKPQVGRSPNRPPYEQYLRVTKAFLK